MVHPVKEAVKVQVHDPWSTFSDVSPCLPDRVMGAPARSVPVAVPREVWIEDRREHLQQRLLDQAVQRRRNAQESYPAPRLRYLHPPDNLGPILSLHSSVRMRSQWFRSHG